MYTRINLLSGLFIFSDKAEAEGVSDLLVGSLSPWECLNKVTNSWQLLSQQRGLWKTRSWTRAFCWIFKRHGYHVLELEYVKWQSILFQRYLSQQNLAEVSRASVWLNSCNACLMKGCALHHLVPVNKYKLQMLVGGWLLIFSVVDFPSCTHFLSEGSYVLLIPLTWDTQHALGGRIPRLWKDKQVPVFVRLYWR